MTERKVHEIGWATFWRAFAILTLIATIYFAKEAVIALLFAIVISSALDGPIVYLNQKFKIPRLLAAALIFAAALIVAGFLIYIVLPVAALELISLSNQVAGTTAGTFLSGFSSVADIVTKDFSIVTLGKISDVLFRGTLPVAQTIGNIVGGIAFGISVLIISFYLTLTQDGVGRFLKAVLPDSVEDSVLKVYYRSKVKIGRWFQAQLLLSVVIGLLVSGGLWILGVKYALVVGLLAAVLEIMPVVGPIFSGSLGTLLALSTSFSLGLYTLLLFVIIQQIENNLLVPLFMKRAVDIHPVVALFSIMVGFQLLGIAGMIIAVPMAVVVQDVIEERVEKKKAMRAGL